MPSRMATLRALAGRSVPTAVLYQIAANAAKGVLARVAPATDGSGASHAELTIGQSLRAIDRTYHRYLFYGDLAPSDVLGKRVLEVGPGDNLGVALRFLLDGAREVVALDRFFSRRNPAAETAIYRAMQQAFPGRDRLFEALIELAASSYTSGSRLSVDGQTLVYVHGVPLEAAPESLTPGFDLIASMAVFEHIGDVEAGLTAIDRLLARGGLSLHEIDLRDHGMFSLSGHHPLTFLTIPPRLWRLMTSHVPGAPNRVHVDRYRRWLDRHGYEYRINVNQVLGEPALGEQWRLRIDQQRDLRCQTVRALASIRPRLLEAYRRLPDEDLLTAGVFLRARR